MHGNALASVVYILFATVLVITLCRAIKVPAMLGYLVVGFIVGPGGFGLIGGGEAANFLGEIGIVFLMFTIGLEFSLPKLRAMRHIVFGLGLAQVVATLLVVTLLTWLIYRDWILGFALGAVAALSSTAIVSKLLNERLELNARHGQMAIGVLLFQDLAVVPLLILLPALGNEGGGLLLDLSLAAVKVVVVMVLLFAIGQRVMRPWFHLVARQRSSELFMINVLLVTLAVSWLTDMAGLSLALGAFVAGMLISETEYRYQVEEDIKPFRDILLGFFFITIGMQLDLSVVTRHFELVLSFFAMLLLGKALLIFGFARLLRYRANDALRTAITLAQGGEFSFVVITLAAKLALLPLGIEQAAIAAVLFSMLASPFLIQHSARLVRLLVRSDWVSQAAELHQVLISSMMRNEHAIICGYGRSGQGVARLLEQENIPFFALDLDPERVREASSAGEAVVFGDAAKKEVLLAAGLMRARVLVVTYADTHSCMRILQMVHEARPDLPVVVRTADSTDAEALRRAGADHVMVEVMEGSLMLASNAMLSMGVPMNRVIRRMLMVRGEDFSVLRGYFRGVSDESEVLDETVPSRLGTVSLVPGAAAIGQTLASLNLGALDVELRAIKRQHARITELAPDFTLKADDVLVLLGAPDHLAAAELLLLEGSSP